MPLTRWDNCLLCHEPFQPKHDYMLKDNIWIGEADIHPNAGVCHILCMEARLGRTLEMSDFANVPANKGILNGDTGAWST